jgi:hypothetical protein
VFSNKVLFNERVSNPSICLRLYSPLLVLGRFFGFLILCTIGRTTWMGDQSVGRPLRTHRTTQTHNKCTQTSIPWVVFELTTPAFEGAKTVHALDRAATMISDTQRYIQERPLGRFIPRPSFTLPLLSLATHFHFIWTLCVRGERINGPNLIVK